MIKARLQKSVSIDYHNVSNLDNKLVCCHCCGKFKNVKSMIKSCVSDPDLITKKCYCNKRYF